MQYFELMITSYLLKDIKFTEANEAISKLINKAMLQDNELKIKHEEKKLKGYVFSSFYPLESDKVYKTGRIYVFKIRSLEEDFAKKLKSLIVKTNTQEIKVIASDLKRIRVGHITEIYTLTPAIATFDNKHWLKGDDFMLLQERMQMNLEKKYQDFFGENLKPQKSFIQGIEIINKKPFSFKYKNTKLLGNKFKIMVNEDEVSQKLAAVALGAGLLEKNSANGMGFCMGRWLR